jgi:hypothetical protein
MMDSGAGGVPSTGIETLAYIATRLRAVLAAPPVDHGPHPWPLPPIALNKRTAIVRASWRD